MNPADYVCPECGLTGVCPIGWTHTSPADLILSKLAAEDRDRREARRTAA